ncbi:MULTISPECIES: hypothetical protein [Agrobacterium]|uniref:Uncharacterized protein n=1 Tax=Agrobacterium tumefaciens TaxID=358 RepID=A0AAF0H0W3_AGRTU|nr:MULTISPECIES: hypothetical protein [Agrobacterium]WGM60822.1 hypothetical protein CFBP5506_14095 [Agrobacterium tumefaciens]CVI62453.1 conserved hypothetical protein [Agrobacterium salinitolerans str. Hayward 0363]
MIIKETDRFLKTEEEHEVYVIYWVDGVRHYYIIPKGFDGFSARRDRDNISVVDNRISKGFRLIRSSSGNDMLLHEALLEGDLLDRLLEPQDPEAVQEFKKKLELNDEKPALF